jgi:hypothetical protein
VENKTVETFIFREKRYQWTINTLLVILGFMCGILYEAERMKVQVVTNTVEIGMIRETLDEIQEKLDTLLEERAVSPLPAVSPAFIPKDGTVKTLTTSS